MDNEQRKIVQFIRILSGLGVISFKELNGYVIKSRDT
jgi:hypothetical protein